MKICVYLAIAFALQMAQNCKGETVRIWEKRCSGVVYIDKCYIGQWDPVNNQGAEDKCAKLEGNLTNIYGQHHMNVLMSYVRDTIGGDMKFHTGMSFNATEDKIHLLNGTDAPVRMKWAPDFPMLHKEWDNVYLRVQDGPSCALQYLMNSVPDVRCGVICETEL